MAGPIGGRPHSPGTMTLDRPVPEQKALLRKEIRQRLTGLSVEARTHDSGRIREWLAASRPWQEADRILGFVPMASEPDLMPLLRAASAAGRTVCVPRWNPQLETYEAASLPPDGGLVLGPFSVLEPAADLPALPLERLDLILVPGLAFDRHGWRLGRGRGFYDRLLRQAVSARRWGIAFDTQVVESVPNEPHDVNVHILVTPQLGLTASE